MKKVWARKKVRPVRRVHLPLRKFALAAFFILGLFLGYLFAVRSAPTVSEELTGFLEYFAKQTVTVDAQLFSKTLLCYLRAAFAVLLLGFSFAGVLLLPFLCAAQSFLFSFSLFSFALVLGRPHFYMLLAFFSLRFFLLPITYFLASAAMDRSIDLALLSFGRGKRAKTSAYDFDYWARFGGASALLFMIACCELWFLPRLLMISL